MFDRKVVSLLMIALIVCAIEQNDAHLIKKIKDKIVGLFKSKPEATSNDGMVWNGTLDNENEIFDEIVTDAETTTTTTSRTETAASTNPIIDIRVGEIETPENPTPTPDVPGPRTLLNLGNNCPPGQWMDTESKKCRTLG